MRKKIPFGLTFLTLFVFSFSLPGQDFHARAAEDPLGGWVFLMSSVVPPKTVCVGDTLTAGVQVKSSGTEDFQVAMDTDIGSPTSTFKDFHKGDRFGLFGVINLKAENPGQRYIQFMSSLPTEGGHAEMTYYVEVLECEYYVRFNATDTKETAVANFKVDAGGASSFTAKDKVEGNGDYGITIETIYNKEDSEGVSCDLIGYMQGNSTFKVTGVRRDQTLYISLEFTQMQFGKSPEFDCEDNNDRQSFLTIFENLTVDPSRDFMMLTGLTFPVEGGKQDFQFGSTGTGTITVTPREKD